MKRILILEDDDRRRGEMQRLLATQFPEWIEFFTPSAPDAIRYYNTYCSEIVAIALDHDLEDIISETGEKLDPGTGRDVSDFLSQQTPTCPIVIHSTNRIAVDGMEFDLSQAGWQVERIAPYADLEWIEEAWLPGMKRILVR